MQPTQQILERCYLFGSRARGEHRHGSDWDILTVVRPEEVDLFESRLCSFFGENSLSVTRLGDQTFQHAYDSLSNSRLLNFLLVYPEHITNPEPALVDILADSIALRQVA